MRAGGIALAWLRLALAAIVVLAAAYILSWQILYSGPVGNDTLFQLHLVQWVNANFPGLAWWYRWDDHGIPYREGYPLAAHWVTAGLDHLLGVSVGQAMQLVQFAITPLGALGVYVYGAWRLRRPLAGLIGAIAYLLSPLTWTFIVDWGFYSNQAGTVLFMPAVIALDVFFEEWSLGRRTWRFRVAAVTTTALIALVGWVAPFLLGAVVAVVFLYGLALKTGGPRRFAAWIFLVAPALVGSAFLLTVFWSVPQQAYLSFINTHVPPRAFDPALFPVWNLGQIFSLHPMHLDQVAERASITPAVGIAAAVGVLAVVLNSRARVLVALVAFGLLTMTTTFLEAVVWNLPVLGYLVHARAGVTLVQFLVPVLAGLGLTEVPSGLAALAARALHWKPRTGLATAALFVTVALALEAIAVGQYAHWVGASSDTLAYGDFQPSTNDIWQRHPPGSAPAADLESQLTPGAWRPLAVGCNLPQCASASPLVAYQRLFASPPQRTVLDANVPQLLMDFNGLTGGGQAYSYNFQLPASPELDGWVLDSMLNRRGTAVKAEVAAATGIDAVVLGSTQAGQAADYKALGWTQTSSSPLTFINPTPTGLATEWPAGHVALVIGSDQQSTSHPYNDLFERATTGMIPSSEAWLLRGRSPYVDDFTAAELAQFPALVLVGYRYHDEGKAWGLLDAYVRAGGSLYVETGWQYVDPDWNFGGGAPGVLPVGELRWGALDPRAPVIVNGSPESSWGPMAYGSGGWGASSASAASLRPGAQPLVSVGGRVVVAGMDVGKGRVVWSGMNLIAHDTGAHSTAEDTFVTGVFGLLLGGAAAAADVSLRWTSDDIAALTLAPSPGTTWVVLRESFAPGWSAKLSWPASAGTAAGSRDVPLLDGELDFLVARLDSVPAGATLTFTYGPTSLVVGSWAISAVSLLLMLAWVARPRWFGFVLGRAGDSGRGLTRRLAWPAGEED